MDLSADTERCPRCAKWEKHLSRDPIYAVYADGVSRLYTRKLQTVIMSFQGAKEEGEEETFEYFF